MLTDFIRVKYEPCFTIYRFTMALTFSETDPVSQECLDVVLAVFSYEKPIHLSSLHMFAFILHTVRYEVASSPTI